MPRHVASAIFRGNKLQLESSFAKERWQDACKQSVAAKCVVSSHSDDDDLCLCFSTARVCSSSILVESHSGDVPFQARHTAEREDIASKILDL